MFFSCCERKKQCFADGMQNFSKQKDENTHTWKRCVFLMELKV